MRKILSILFLTLWFSIGWAQTNGPVTFTPESVDVPCGAATFCVDIDVVNFDSILALQFSIAWDTASMTLDTYEDYLPGNVTYNPNQTDEGLLGISWSTGFNPIGVPDNDSIFTLCFVPNNAVTGSVSLGPPLTGGNVEVSGILNGQLVQFLPFDFNTGTVVYTSDELPAIDCPNDTTVNAPGVVNDIDYVNLNSSCVNSTVTYELIMNGNVVGSGTGSASGESFDTGTTTVEYTATDGSGNTDVCSFNVIVDFTPPGQTDTFLQIIPQVTLDCDAGTVSIDVMVIDFIDMLSMQFGIFWDTSMVSFSSLSNNLTNASFFPPAPDSALWFTWPSGGDPVSLADSTIIFTLNFDLNGSFSLPVLTFQDFSQVATVNLTSDWTGGNGVSMIEGVHFEFSDPVLVNVIDGDPPVLSNCPTDTIVYSDAGVCGTNASWLSPSATDICDDQVAISSTHDSGSFFDLGTTTVTYTATDDAGNTSICSFNVIVLDSLPPAITCPADVNMPNADGLCSAVVTLPQPVALSDNCGVDQVTYMVSSTGTGGTLTPTTQEGFLVGSATVTYIASDTSDNTTSCSYEVTIIDMELPTISCPADTVVNSGTAIVVDGISATANDNCGDPVVTYSLAGATSTPGPNTDDASGTAFEPGITTVTYYATDGNGMVDSCSFTVNVTTALDIECPDVVNPAQDADPPFCSDQVFGIDLIINSDENDIVVFTFTLSGATELEGDGDAGGETFNVGITTVTYFVEDVFGNTATCSFDVEVIDNTPPSVGCPNVDTFTADPSDCEATVNPDLILPVDSMTFDYCGLDSVAYSFSGMLSGEGDVNNMPNVFPIGITTITYTAFDIHGNSDDCSFEVEVIDGDDPVISSCPPDLIVMVPPGVTDTVLNNLGITASDVCGNVVSITYSTNTGLVDTLDISGTAFPIGTTIVTYSVLDDSGNEATCNFTIQVVPTSTDLIDCPPSATFCDNIATDISPIILVDPATLDTLFFTSDTGPFGGNDASGIAFLPGTSIVTYQAVDIFGNTDECSFSVTIDDVDPVWDGCPTVPMEVEVDPGECTATVNWIVPTATDNCGLEVNTSSHPPPPVQLEVGEHEINYIAIDSAGNQAICNFIVIVFDTEPPVFDVCPPSDIVITPTGSGNCQAEVTWTPPTATDLCSDLIVYEGSPDPGSIFDAGTTTVIYTATDESGNVAICTFDVVVEDTEAPVIVNCPEPFLLDADPDYCGAIVSWTPPTATDNCSTVGVSCSHMPGDTFDIGLTTVICLAVDALGNDTTCSFTVEVVDVTAPVVDNCPGQDILQSSDTGQCGATVFWPQPNVIDECDTEATLTSNFEPGDFFEVGVTTVMYIGEDSGGNTDTCTFDVIIEDNEAPVIDCSPNVIVGMDEVIYADTNNIIVNITPNATCDSLIIDFEEPDMSDNCPGFTIVHPGPNSGDTFPIGFTVMSYEVTDTTGNSAECVFTIEVLPFSPLNLTASPNDTVCTGTDVVLSVDQTPGATYLWTGPGGWSSMDPSPIIPSTSGIYNVLCTAPSGCVQWDSIPIVFDPAPAVTVSSNSPVCGDSLTLSATAQGVDAVLWTAPDGSEFTTADVVIFDPGDALEGTWTVEVTLGECVVTEAVPVEIGEMPTVSLLSDCNGVICQGESCTLIGTEVVGSDVTYNWDSAPPGCIPVGANTSVLDISPTLADSCIISYWVSTPGCISNIAEIMIAVAEDPLAVADDYSVSPGDSITFDVSENDVVTSSISTTVSVLTPPLSEIRGTLVVNADGTMTYTAPEGFAGTVQFIYQICNNCMSESCATAAVTITIIDDSCLVPNVITPNGDDVNDALVIGCLEGNFPDSEIQIFNRWGDEVFYAQPYLNDWKGTWEGKDLPDGTYYYIFTPDVGIGEVDKGYITIFR